LRLWLIVCWGVCEWEGRRQANEEKSGMKKNKSTIKQ